MTGTANAPVSENEKAAQDLSGPLPVDAKALLARFEELGIAHTLYEHAPVFTVAESGHLDETIPGMHCRNLFLRDKKKNSYLVVAANVTAIDLKKLPDLLGSGRLSFGSAERLWEMLGVRPGSVCPFAIMNDTAGAVEIFLDKTMMDADLVCYHPMENHMTVALAPADLVRFIQACNHEPRVIDLAQATPEEA